jgi:predicted DsbA family dithiol-disulfide isomerase
MSSKDYETLCNEKLGICGPHEEMSASMDSIETFPIEIYTFLDPLCPECWAFEPTLRKLQVEYGQYFRIRYFVSGKMETWNPKALQTLCNSRVKNLAKVWEKTANRTGMSCDGDIWFEDPISSPYVASLAVKAAEMQGRQSGTKFLRKLREFLFLNKMNISKESVLVQCAKEIGLDISEFKHDLHSPGAVKALQCDVKTTREMGVDCAPTFIFFNNKIEEEGLKVAGFYPYEIYVEILHTMLGHVPCLNKRITLEDFLERYKFVATKEVAVVFDWSIEEAERQLKKLFLKQIVERVPVKYGTFWRYKK